MSHTSRNLNSLGEANGYARRCADHSGYVTPIGKLPSVTTVVGATKSEQAKKALENWLSRPGSEQRSLAARTRGTYLHTQAENWINGLPTSRHFVWGSYWDGLEEWLGVNFHSALGVEFPIWHPHGCGFSGTVDCVGLTYESSEPQLIDWKTRQGSGPLDPTSEMFRHGYFIQLAAYRAGIKWTYGITVNSALLVVARQFGSADVISLDCDLLNECEAEFYERLEVFAEMQANGQAS